MYYLVQRLSKCCHVPCVILIITILYTICPVKCLENTLPTLPSAQASDNDVEKITNDESVLSNEMGEGESTSNGVEFMVMYVNTKSPPIQLEGFESCDTDECYQVCGTKESNKAFCDTKNGKVCMCAMDNFITSNVEGNVASVNREDLDEKNCSLACNIRNSYARIWRMTDTSKKCICLLNQITVSGITLCDESAAKDLCKTICQTPSAVCTFNGVCLCRHTWNSVFTKSLPNIRNELRKDNRECSNRCKEYHSQFVARIYDTKIGISGSKTYDFRDKYCLCGEEMRAVNTTMMEKLHNQGFQECTALKCRMRCGMNMLAACEPIYRRACLCPRYNIFIGKFLWARIPSRSETVCLEACRRYGLASRVIEWNPFFDPKFDLLNGVYRKSKFQYLYDGKFCHCVNLKNEPDINQFRPCTDELCQWICGHAGATCDQKTRRVCICNTHQMVGGLGRRPDPAEINCNIICRRNLHNARILEVHWDVPAPFWSVPKAKFCGCVRPVSAAGLSHCEGMDGKDICPQLCRNPMAYCTQDKVCECFTQPTLLKDAMVRVPNGKEAEECGEICRSWTWPLAEDTDHQPYIYDESRKDCTVQGDCSPQDTTSWSLDQPGALQVQIDALEEDPDSPKKYCLCAKSDDYFNKPGLRINAKIEPRKLPKSLQCVGNFTCLAVAESIHVVARVV